MSEFDSVVEGIRELEAERTKYKNLIMDIIAHFSYSEVLKKSEYEQFETKHLQA